MLTRLRISNFILIEELHLSIIPGMTVMTGETGAGKSILLGALGAALGERLSTKSLLKDPNKKAVVELEFSVKDSLRHAFEERDLDFDSRSVFRREFLPTGKSRAFINDTPAKLSDLSDIGGQFIDINSQSESGLLSDVGRQLSLIDAFGEHQSELEQYDEIYRRWNQIKSDIATLHSSADTEDVDYLEFIHNELKVVSPKVGEDVEIEEQIQRLRVLAKNEKVLEGLSYLLDSDNGLFDAFYSLEKYAKDLSLWDDEDRVLKFNEALGFLNDIRREVQNLKQGSDEVVELSLLEERLRRIKDLIRKHRVLTADELVQKQRDIEDRLEHMRLRETKLAELESEVVKVEGQLVQIGESLHSKRIEAGKVIEKMLLDYLERVDLPKAHLKLNWESHSNPTKSGLYKPVFMFSANPGKLMEPLHKVASGGEQSRVKLALKAVLGEYSQLSCQIFDEIDTGISGSTAERIGSLMKTMAKSQQIIAITHLPQVAAAGTEHWKVMKQQDENDTVSTVQILSAEERIEEVARLMSGQKITDVAKKQAQALLSQS